MQSCSVVVAECSDELKWNGSSMVLRYNCLDILGKAIVDELVKVRLLGY